MSDHKCPDSGFDQGVRAERARLAARVEGMRRKRPMQATGIVTPQEHFNAGLDAVLALLREGA